MRLPVVRGLIDRRILVNYQVEPDVLAPLLPRPFRPKLVAGRGIAGLCLIRLRQLRPAYIPAWFGLASENAAHRIAVEWDDRGTVREGVYVCRRDTDSQLNCLVGGRIFPGVHHRARFQVRESEERYELAIDCRRGAEQILVRACRTADWPAASVFRSRQEASTFFERGSLGYSPAPASHALQSLELVCFDWQVESLAIEELRSSFFDDEARFPQGTIRFDCALLMRGIRHQWHCHADLQPEACCAAANAAAC